MRAIITVSATISSLQGELYNCNLTSQFKPIADKVVSVEQENNKKPQINIMENKL